jgi:hypothetical protein
LGGRPSSARKAFNEAHTVRCLQWVGGYAAEWWVISPTLVGDICSPPANVEKIMFKNIGLHEIFVVYMVGMIAAKYLFTQGLKKMLVMVFNTFIKTWVGEGAW